MPTDYTPPRITPVTGCWLPSSCNLCGQRGDRMLELRGGSEHCRMVTQICPDCLRSIAEQATALLTTATEPEPPPLSLDAQHLQDEMNRLNGNGWVARDVSPTRVRAERLNEFVECRHDFNGGNPMWFCSRMSGAPWYFIAPWKRLTPSKETDR